MKATITSTDRVVDIAGTADGVVQARVWEGVSDGGVPFTAYVTLVQVLRTEDNSEFERELHEHKAPEPATRRAIDARFIL